MFLAPGDDQGCEPTFVRTGAPPPPTPGLDSRSPGGVSTVLGGKWCENNKAASWVLKGPRDPAILSLGSPQGTGELRFLLR